MPIETTLTRAVRDVLDAFEKLPADERQVATAVILQRAAREAMPPLDDDALNALADLAFQSLDAEEEAHARGNPG